MTTQALKSSKNVTVLEKKAQTTIIMEIVDVPVKDVLSC